MSNLRARDWGISRARFSSSSVAIRVLAHRKVEVVALGLFGEQRNRIMNAPVISSIKYARETVTYDEDAPAIVEQIRSDLNLKRSITRIRQLWTEAGGHDNLKAAKEAVGPDKKTLRAVMWSGRFKNREKPADPKLITHSGLLCADLDGLDGRLDDVRTKIRQSDCLWFSFVSPTGDGLKAVFRVPADATKHNGSFLAVKAHVAELTGERIDESCKEVSRLCFLSFDPESYFNPNAAELEPIVEPPKKKSAGIISGSAEIEKRKQIATQLLGEISWDTEAHGFCACPGKLRHTAGDADTDCEIYLDNVPTLHCFHSSCRGIVEDVNHGLRSRIAKAEQTAKTAGASPVADIRGEIIAIWTDDNLSQAEQRTRIAKAVVQALSRRGKFFFHGERRDFESAMFFDNERKRLERIRSDSFLAWVSDWLRVNRADVLFRYISSEIETAALTESLSMGIIPEAFWAARSGAIYLSNGDAGVAKITPGAVKLVDNGTDGVLFSAGDTLKPWELAEAVDPFETCSLFRKANCAAAHGSDLLRTWILSFPTNPPCKPPLCMAGDVGSGKTRLAKGVAELYGIPFTANNVDDFGDENFWVSIDGGGLFTLDNCDTRTKWVADAVSAAATDGCRDRRKLYTDIDRVKLRARAWICLTTANPTFAGDTGLGDRLLVVRMNRRTDETLDSLLSDEIKQHRNSGLSFIARALAATLADHKSVPTGLNKRHPDFAAFAVKIGRAIGRGQQAVDALQIAEKDKSLFCLENDYIASALLDFLAATKGFTGTAKELRGKLVEFDSGFINEEGKPSAKSIGGRLRALWPHLENMLAIAKQEKDRTRSITYNFEAPSAEFAEFKSPFQQKSLYARI